MPIRVAQITSQHALGLETELPGHLRRVFVLRVEIGGQPLHAGPVAQEIDGETRGYTTTDGTRRVVVDVDMEPAMQAKTALHEMAHVILHVNGDGQRIEDAPSRAVRELEAESAAYVAGAILGLDTEAYSERYLLGWAGHTGQPAGEAVKATAARVQKAVAKMVKVLGGDA